METLMIDVLTSASRLARVPTGGTTRETVMATAAAEQQRHPLGLPAGSVRAILSSAVLGLLWAILLTTPQPRQLPLVFFYLSVLMVLVLACFFAAHGKTIGHQVSKRSP